MLIVVTGTGTEVGKTWVTAALVAELQSAGATCAARKPAQSFDPDDPSPLDADVLGAATGEDPSTVCPRHRWYTLAMAPPIAARLLSAPEWTIRDLVDEMEPSDAQYTFVEGAGGLRSPIARDGDVRTLVHALQPSKVIVVADAGLGTINAVRHCVEALTTSWPGDPIIVLNRFERTDAVHTTNVDWLREFDGYAVATSIQELATLVTTP